MKVNSEQEMIEAGRRFAREILAADSSGSSSEAAGPKLGVTVIELVGDVGAGKTTFTRGLAEGLGVKEAISSPSFTISKAYALPTGGNLVHYDFYRLEDPGVMSEDLMESIEGAGNVVVVEWGESVAEILPEARRKIEIRYNEEGGRDIIGI